MRHTRVAHHGEGEPFAARALAERSRRRSPIARSWPGMRPALAHREGTAIDAGGLLPDVAEPAHGPNRVDVSPIPSNSSRVQLCNSTAPFLLVSRLRASMRAAVAAGPAPYVVNVSAMEGQFSRRYKGSGHPHEHGRRPP